MNRQAKSFLTASTILLGMFGLGACGDDSANSSESSKETDSDALPECTKDNDAETATREGSSNIYVCKDKSWEILDTTFVAGDTASSLGDIPNCAEKQEGNSYYIEESGVSYICEDNRWEIVVVSESAASSSSEGEKSSSSEASANVSSSSDGEKDSSSSETVSSSSEGSSSSVKGSSSSVSSNSSAASGNSSSSDASSSSSISNSSSDAVSSATESSSSADVSGSSEESSSSVEESSSSRNGAATRDELPNCTDSYAGEIYYVESESAEYVCSDREWGKAELCGTAVMNAANQFCKGGEIFARGDYCGYEINGDAYPLTEYYCKNDTAYLKSEYSLCGAAYYNTLTHFCNNDTIHELCGGEEYDPKTHFCYKDSIYEMCGGSTYTPREDGFCIDNSFYKFYLYENRKNQGYFEDPRDHQLYRIGSVGDFSKLHQLWMLQNLNYKMTHSLCYAEDNINYSNNANCSTYGRLYRFSEAYRACPAGWHLPTDKEFKAYPHFIDNYSYTTFKLDTALTGKADSSSIAGKYLKADTSLWVPYDGIENSEDGQFFALPGGWGDVNRSTSLPTFYQLGKMAFFWTSTYDSPYATGAYGTTGKAMALILRYDSDKAVFRESDVYEALSVRCVRVEN